MTARVVQWATGHVGLDALRAIIKHPDLELVGVRVYSDAKDGVDAGELCGLPPTGVLASKDVDAVLGLQPDCVCYTATETAGIDPVVDDFCRILESGSNVVASTLLPLVFPPDLSPMFGPAVERIEAACRTGGTTLFVTGVNPGCLLDVIPPLIAGGCRDIRSIEVTEHYDDISWYEAGALARDLFGISLAPEAAEAMREVRLGIMTEYFGCALKLLAHGLGSRLGEITATFDMSLASEPFALKELTVDAGCVGAAHAKLEAMAGPTRLAYHEYVSGSPTVPRPDWPEPPRGGGGYVVDIEGDPDVRFEVSFGRGGALAMADAFAYTSNRLVNAIPAVCAAEAGLSPFLDIARNVAGRIA